MSTPVTAQARPRARWRWSVALLATLLLVVSGSGLVAFAQEGSAVSQGPVFVPADSPIYAEVRLDMPEGQGEALAQLLTAFPGFADAESFPTKRDELIASIVEMAGSDDGDALSGLLSSMTGEVGLAVTALTPEDATSEDLPMVIGIAITDRTAVEATLTGLAEGAATETYGAATLIGSDDTTVGVTDAWVLISPQADEVRAAIDTLGGQNPSLASDPEFTAAFGRVPAAHLAAIYFDMQSLLPLIEASLAQSGVEALGMPITDLASQLPIDMVAYLFAEPDRLTLEAHLTPSAAMQAVPLGESDLADIFPAETQLYLETRELGTTITNALTAVTSMMDEESSAQMAPVEDMIGGLLAVMSDASIGVGLTAGQLWLGAAAEVSDEAEASTALQSILTLVNFAAADPESGISMTTESVGGAEVTTITLPIDSEEMGLPVDIGQTISLAVADGRLLFGSGDFVATALTQDPASGLGATEGWLDAVGADTTNSGVVYANIGSLLAQLDPMLAAMVPEWAEIAPYATALDRFVVVGTAADDVVSARMSIIMAPSE